jgi:hypothetical protein
MSRHYGSGPYSVQIERDEQGRPKKMVWETNPLDAGPQARRTDPETSHEAAGQWTQEGLTALQWIVLVTLKSHGPMIDQELVDIIQRDHPSYGDSSIRTRRGELVVKGKVFHAGYSKTASGGRSRVWRAA